MPSVIQVPNLRDGYVQIVRTIVNDGRRVAPRGQATRELRNVTIELLNPYDALPVGVGRRLNTTIGLLEAAQLVGGVSVPETVARLAPNIATMSAEPDGTYWGAYGYRMSPVGELHQLWHVVRKLREDPDSRQAIVDLWDRRWDNEPGHRDYPCTNHLSFFIRDGQLELDVLMRSNDAWLGLCYDAFQFTQCQISVAHALNIEVGSYCHTARSLHVYERDLDAIKQLHSRFKPPPSFAFDGFGRPGDEIEHITTRAKVIALGLTDKFSTLDFTMTEQRYVGALHG